MCVFQHMLDSLMILSFYVVGCNVCCFCSWIVPSSPFCRWNQSCVFPIWFGHQWVSIWCLQNPQVFGCFPSRNTVACAQKPPDLQPKVSYQSVEVYFLHPELSEMISSLRLKSLESDLHIHVWEGNNAWTKNSVSYFVWVLQVIPLDKEKQNMTPAYHVRSSQNVNLQTTMLCHGYHGPSHTSPTMLSLFSKKEQLITYFASFLNIADIPGLDVHTQNFPIHCLVWFP